MRVVKVAAAIAVLAAAIFLCAGCVNGYSMPASDDTYYTVSYVVNGGETLTRQVREYDYAPELYPEAEEGKEFVCWLCGGEEYDFGKRVTGDLVLTARFDYKIYKVVYKDGDEIAAERTYTINDKNISEPEPPQRRGYYIRWEDYELSIGDKTVQVVYTPIQYTITFIADEFSKEIKYTVEDSAIIEPQVPVRDGYKGEWSEYSLDCRDITVTADYTPINYTANFIADGEKVYSARFNVENMNVIPPEVPERAGYVGEWEEYELGYEDIEIRAVYTLIIYRATFIADGKQIHEARFSVENMEITPPEVPTKAGYVGKWEEYELGYCDIEIRADYSLITYRITFMADGKIVGEDEYTVESESVAEPAVPNKEGYDGRWEEYLLNGGDITVNAVYTRKTYTLTCNGWERTYQIEFTLDDEIELPPVPERSGYTGQWESFERKAQDITINALYTPIVYKLTFVADGVTVAESEYTVESQPEIPPVPEKKGYTGVWSEFELYVDATLTAIYTENEIPTFTSGLIYERVSGGYCVTGIESSVSEIVIPAEYDGEKVIEIGAQAFLDDEVLEKVVFGAQIKKIGQDAFNSCVNLKQVELNGGLEEIGARSFAYCAITEITIPDSVATVKEYAFTYCDGLSKITIGAGVKIIERRAFLRCENIESVTFANTENWYRATDRDSTDGELITDFKSPAAAAQYILDNSNYYFVKH